MSDYALPPKVLSAFRRLRLHYDGREEADLCELIDVSRIYVEVETNYDNWNGGTWGHDVIMLVPEEKMGLVDLDEQAELLGRICQDLNKATPEVENEYIRAVHISPVDAANPQSQASIAFSRQPQARPEEVGLWKENTLRLFISHRDQAKDVAHRLADALEPYGVSSFVAHDAIKPMKEWQEEILKGMITMEVMLVLMTDEFHDSEWTNQEVGFALGRGIPIICVKTGRADPKGFIGKHQALKMPSDLIDQAASEVLKALLSEVGQAGRIKEILVEAFVRSQSYIDAIGNLERLTDTAEKLNERDFLRITNGYRDNDQLYTCAGIHTRGNWFKRYLENATGKKLEFEGNRIVEVGPELDENIPL